MSFARSCTAATLIPCAAITIAAACTTAARTAASDGDCHTLVTAAPPLLVLLPSPLHMPLCDTVHATLLQPLLLVLLLVQSSLHSFALLIRCHCHTAGKCIFCCCGCYALTRSRYCMICARCGAHLCTAAAAAASALPCAATTTYTLLTLDLHYAFT